MAGKYLIDANILVYSFDNRYLEKQQKAADLIRILTDNEFAALSTQALGEFYNAVTKRIPFPLSPVEAYMELEAFLNSFWICDLTATVILDAARAAREHQMHYWDAQIWATAKLYEIPTILTEDLPGKERIEMIQYINPLLPEFDLASLIEDNYRS